MPKIRAAKLAGVEKVLIPKANMQEIIKEFDGITIIPVEHISEVIEQAIEKKADAEGTIRHWQNNQEML